VRGGRLHGWIASAFAWGATACSQAEGNGNPSAADAAASDDTGADVTAQPDTSSPDTGAGETGVDAPTDGVSDDASDAGDCLPGSQGEPPDLSCGSLYSDWASKTVASDALEYTPGLVLWSDGATKTRWVQLPAGATIDTSDMDEWTFPVGTKFWKEFVVGGKRIETRLLWKQTAAAWYMTTYQWSPDDSSAPELTVGALNVDGNGYEIPSQIACHTCHDGREDIVLGFEAVALSSANASGVTIGTLTAAPLLTSPPSSALTVPGAATSAAALGYLHMNCGTSCHNRGTGMAGGTGFYMRLEVAQLGSVSSTDTVTTGVGRTSQYSIPGVTTSYRLEPNDLASSSVYYRMDQRDGVNDAGVGTQMPPIDSHRVDDAGVGAIAAWIDAGCH